MYTSLIKYMQDKILSRKYVLKAHRKYVKFILDNY